MKRISRVDLIETIQSLQLSLDAAQAERDEARKELRNMGLARQDFLRVEAERDRLAAELAALKGDQ